MYYFGQNPSEIYNYYRINRATGEMYLQRKLPPTQREFVVSIRFYPKHVGHL